MLFDIVIPTVDTDCAAKVINSLRENSTYANLYTVIDNGDSPIGYVPACNAGAKVGTAEVVCFVNDDLLVNTQGWDEVLWEETQKGTVCFGPWIPQEDTMRLNGWFLCLRRDYIDKYGWPFDPQFTQWCGDIDLLMRLEQDGHTPVMVRGIEIEHDYSATFSIPEFQNLFIPQQLEDLDKFKAKWGVDANEAKIRKE